MFLSFSSISTYRLGISNYQTNTNRKKQSGCVCCVNAEVIFCCCKLEPAKVCECVHIFSEFSSVCVWLICVYNHSSPKKKITTKHTHELKCTCILHAMPSLTSFILHNDHLHYIDYTLI